MRTSRADIHLSYAATFFNLGAGVIVLPLILVYLPSAQIGMWYVFMSINALALVVDAGLSPTIARFVGYAWGGVSSLTAPVAGQATSSGIVNEGLMRGLLRVSNEIYRKVTTWIVIGVATIGTVYVLRIGTDIDPTTLWVSWALLLLGVYCNIRFNSMAVALRGAGVIAKTQVAMILSRVAQILACSALVWHRSLIVPCAAFVLSAIVFRLAMQRLYRTHFAAILAGNDASQSGPPPAGLVRQIWEKAALVLFWSLGNYGITQFGLIFVSYYYGLHQAGSFGVTLQILTILSAISSTLSSVYLVECNRMVVAGDHAGMRKVIGKSLRAAWLLFALGTFVLVAAGPTILGQLNSNADLLSPSLMLLAAGVVALEMNSNICSVFISTFNAVPYWKSSLLSAAAMVPLTFVFDMLGAGILGVLLARGVAQAAYSYWKWPLQLHRMVAAK